MIVLILFYYYFLRQFSGDRHVSYSINTSTCSLIADIVNYWKFMIEANVTKTQTHVL